MANLGKSVKGKGKAAKKGGKGAKVEISAAEKALEDKIRRLKENDERVKIAFVARQRLTEEMSQEMKATKINKLRIQNQWRKIMRLAKVESLRKDIEIFSQNHERDVDRKDAIIQMLDRDLEEAEDQYQMALRAHLQNIDKLIDLQDQRLLGLENEFEGDLTTLSDEFNAEREQIEKQHTLEKTELLGIMNAVDSGEHEREAEAKQEHEQTREEIRNKNLEDINVLRITLESTIEELERHFESAHLNYLQNTDQRTQDFKYLTRKDQELSKDIEVKIRKIEKLQSSLAHWRTKINQNCKECEERNSALKEEKDQISKHFQQLKLRMNRFRDRQGKRLTDLTKNVRQSKGMLQEKLSLAERILKLAELARKLETQQEKILPFYQSTTSEVEDQEGETKKPLNDEAEGTLESKDDPDQEFGDHGNAQKRAGEEKTSQGNQESELDNLRACGIDTFGKPVQEWEYLNNFFKRYNKVMLDKLAVEREKERLEKENKDLQSVLKQYLDGITVNPEVMNNENPLLVVNGKVNFRKPAVHRQGPPCVVEGGLIAKRY